MLVQFHGGPLHGQRRDLVESPDSNGVIVVTLLDLGRAIEEGARALEQSGAGDIALLCRRHASRLKQTLVTARYKRRLAGKDGVFVFYHVEEGT